jgi:4a-hydroxytetrahydrobiopterin dehydratase
MRLKIYSSVMSRPAKLSPQEVTSALSALPGWSVLNGKLHREYKFPDFTYAFAFMAAIAAFAEKLDHHPDWSNVYNTVAVNLSTHDVGGITELDFKLAGKMEIVAGKLMQ